MLKDTDIAWLAGYLEGEGCIRAPKPYAKTVGIDVASTDLDVIQRVASLMQCTFSVVHQKNSKWKTQYRISLTGHRAVIVMEMILPYMGERRANKIKLVTDYWANKPVTRRGIRWNNEPIKYIDGVKLLLEIEDAL